MICNRYLFSLFFATVLIAATSLFADVKPFVLVDNGQAAAVIVIPSDAKPGIKFAARELADYLGKMSGARFMISDKPLPGLKSILIGTPYKTDQVDELCIRVKDANTLELTGYRSRGALYAVYELLESLGVVFCTRDWDYIPKTNRVEIAGNFSKVDAPCMWAVRSTWSDTGRVSPENTSRLRYSLRGWKECPDLAADYEWDVNHAIPYRWVSKHPEAKKHPEWFAYVRSKDPSNYNGEQGGGITAGVAEEVARKARNYNWICMSNEEMWKVLLDGIETTLAKNPNCRELSVAIGDCADYCECDKCLETVAKYPDPDGSILPVVQTYLVANRIGKHFAKKYPNVRFNMLPYGGRQPAATNLFLEPNVGGCSAELWRNHCLPADCNERSKYSLALFCDKVTNPKNGTYVWEYLANFSDWMIPFPNVYIMAASMRYYKRLGVTGVVTQHQFSGLGDLSEMKLWLHAKLQWNPDADIDKLIDTYCNAAFGPAAKYIRQYVNIVEHARLRQRWTWYGCYVPDTSHFLSDDDCVKIYKAAVAAEAAVSRYNKQYLPTVRRAIIPAISVAIWRYEDMLGPAQAMRVKMPPLQDLWKKWHSIVDDTSNSTYWKWYSEGGSDYNKRITQMFGKDFQPTNHIPKLTVRDITAKELTGGKRMVKGRDKDGTEYARIKISLQGEPEKIWMNPNFAEIGYTVKPEEAGDWYVFADIRVGTMFDGDPTVAYVGMYQKWYPNGFLVKRNMEVANQAVVGRIKDKGKWQTVCLGKRRLFPESRIWVMPGVLHPCEYIDVKGIKLISPAVIENSVAK